MLTSYFFTLRRHLRYYKVRWIVTTNMKDTGDELL